MKIINKHFVPKIDQKAQRLDAYLSTDKISNRKISFKHIRKNVADGTLMQVCIDLGYEIEFDNDTDADD